MSAWPLITCSNRPVRELLREQERDSDGRFASGGGGGDTASASFHGTEDPVSWSAADQAKAGDGAAPGPGPAKTDLSNSEKIDNHGNMHGYGTTASQKAEVETLNKGQLGKYASARAAGLSHSQAMARTGKSVGAPQMKTTAESRVAYAKSLGGTPSKKDEWAAGVNKMAGLGGRSKTWPLQTFAPPETEKERLLREARREHQVKVRLEHEALQERQFAERLARAEQERQANEVFVTREQERDDNGRFAGGGSGGDASASGRTGGSGGTGPNRAEGDHNVGDRVAVVREDAPDKPASLGGTPGKSVYNQGAPGTVTKVDGDKVHVKIDESYPGSKDRHTVTGAKEDFVNAHYLAEGRASVPGSPTVNNGGTQRDIADWHERNMNGDMGPKPSAGPHPSNAFTPAPSR